MYLYKCAMHYVLSYGNLYLLIAIYMVICTVYHAIDAEKTCGKIGRQKAAKKKEKL